jgi:glucokinase
MNHYAGIDLGGSSIKAGIIDDEGNIVLRKNIEIDKNRDFTYLAQCMAEAFNGLRSGFKGTIKAVGIGMPGFVNKTTGIHEGGSENIPGLPGNPIIPTMTDLLKLPVSADNDGTCAAAGEHLFGAGREFSDFALLTLGTGIGGGLVLGGKLYTGKKGFAGEIGHTSLDPLGPVCNCGSRGCFEQYSAGPAIMKAYRDMLRKRELPVPREALDNNARLVFDNAANGDALAREAVDNAARMIALAIGNLINILNIEACLLGGGLSRAGETLLAPVRAHIADYAWPTLVRGFRVINARLQNDAGLIGAAAIAKISLQS